MNPDLDNERSDVVFVYDGACPICSRAAQATRIRQNIGDLILVDARNDRHHPVLVEIADQNLDLDEGMVIKYRQSYYHGENALKLMAELAAGDDWFNRTNRFFFKNRQTAHFAYPLMRAARNLLIALKGTPKIKPLKKRP